MAQVTNHHIDSGSAEGKLQRLAEHDAVDESHRILFCQADELSSRDDVIVFPLDEAFYMW
jgi:hypothetical protein